MVDAEMMEVVRVMADSVTGMIRWECDHPDLHEDASVAVLDLKLSIDMNDLANLVKYHFYQKEMSNKNLISAASSTPSNMRFSTLVEEGCRRLRNTSAALLAVEKDDLVREYNVWLYKAGYSQKYRLKVTETFLDRFDKMTDDEIKDVRKIHRNKNEILAARKERKKL